MTDSARELHWLGPSGRRRRVNLGGGNAPGPRRKAGKVQVYRAFNAAKTNHLFPASIGSPQGINEDLAIHNAALRRRAREEAQNNEYVSRVLQLVRRNVVGPTGIRLRADFRMDGSDKGPRDEADIALVEREWAEWSRAGNCDVTGKISLKAAQDLFIESLVRDGEVFIRLIKGWRGNRWRFAFQFLDPEYFREDDNSRTTEGNVVIMGIELDDWGRPLAYNLRKRPGETLHQAYLGRQELQRLPAAEVIHSFLAHRPGQVRGYTAFAAAFGRIHQLKGYEEAEVIAARVAAEKMGFIISPGGDEYDGEEVGEDGVTEMRSEPGGWEQLAHGTQIETYDPSHPNSAMPDFIKSMLRAFASGVGISYNDIASDLEGVNYSSLRHGALSDRAGWRDLQQQVIDQLLQPLYMAWLDMSILAGVIPFPRSGVEKFRVVQWEPRGFEWVDPKKEIDADVEAYRLGVSSLTEILARRGTNPEKVFAERAAELKLAEKYGVPVDAGLSQPSSPVDGSDDPDEA